MGAGLTLTGRRRDGSEFPVDVSLSPVRTAHGTLIAVAVRDISEQRRIAEALERAEAQLRELWEQASDGIFVANLEGRYTAVNGAACRMLGYAREELVGKTILDLILPEDAPRLAADRAALETPGHVAVSEWELLCKDGSLLPVEVSAKILADGRWQAIVRDIRDRRRAERAREEEQARLTQLRAEWIAVVAHDLRQPLSAIVFNAQILARDAGAAGPLQEALTDIAESAERLNRMILDLLDLGRLEAHQMALRRQPVDLPRLARKSLERATGSADGRSLYLEVRGEIPPVFADADRLAQILDNLVSNAIKYGAEGSAVLLVVERCNGDVAASVTNEGVGITADAIPHLFQRFHRAADGRLASVKGVGLGLYIARELVEAHGGRIGVESARDGKTTFRFTLPVA
jgi:PAS domain S-box-containing protein